MPRAGDTEFEAEVGRGEDEDAGRATPRRPSLAGIEVWRSLAQQEQRTVRWAHDPDERTRSGALYTQGDGSGTRPTSERDLSRGERLGWFLPRYARAAVTRAARSRISAIAGGRSIESLAPRRVHLLVTSSPDAHAGLSETRSSRPRQLMPRTARIRARRLRRIDLASRMAPHRRPTVSVFVGGRVGDRDRVQASQATRVRDHATRSPATRPGAPRPQGRVTVGERSSWRGATNARSARAFQSTASRQQRRQDRGRSRAIRLPIFGGTARSAYRPAAS